MADSPIHFEQADHNETLAWDLATQNPVKYKDWAVIIAFYSAIHYIEAFLSKEGIHTEDYEKPHIYRKNLVKQKLKIISIEYVELYHMSMTLRYLTNRASTSSMGKFLLNSDITRLVQSNLDNIKNEIKKRCI